MGLLSFVRNCADRIGSFLRIYYFHHCQAELICRWILQPRFLCNAVDRSESMSNTTQAHVPPLELPGGNQWKLFTAAFHCARRSPPKHTCCIILISVMPRASVLPQCLVSGRLSCGSLCCTAAAHAVRARGAGGRATRSRAPLEHRPSNPSPPDQIFRSGMISWILSDSLICSYWLPGWCEYWLSWTIRSGHSSLARWDVRLNRACGACTGCLSAGNRHRLQFRN